MEISILKLAEDYYTLMGEKREELEKYLHPQVEFFGPLASYKGKEEVIKAIKQFMNAFTTLEIKEKCGSAEQVMIVYEVILIGLDKALPSAALLEFKEGLIIRIQLFFDASSFRK